MTKTLSDQELLKLAARAAGIDWFDEPALQAGKGLHMKSGPFWNPLTDDGDALRLAVNLGLDVDQETHGPYVWVLQLEGFISEPCGLDRVSATRRAIVRAAAMLAKVEG